MNAAVVEGDARTERLVVIRRPDGGGSAIGVWPTDARSGPFGTATVAFVGATERLLQQLDDIKHRPLAPREMVEANASAGAAAVRGVEDAAAELVKADAILRKQVQSLRPFPDVMTGAGYGEVGVLLAMAERFRTEMTAADRASLIAVCSHADASASPLWQQCLAQCPVEVTGLQPAQRDAVALAVVTRREPQRLEVFTRGAEEHRIALAAAASFSNVAGQAGARAHTFGVALAQAVVLKPIAVMPTAAG